MSQHDQSDSYTSRKPTRIKVSVGQTIPLEQYSNVRYDFAVEEDVPAGKKTSEHLIDVTKRLEAMLASKAMEYGYVQEG